MLLSLLTPLSTPQLSAQALGEADRSEPGDPAIQAYLKAETEKLEGSFDWGLASAEAWTQKRPAYLQEYLYMLGLWPMPERTPLEPRITGTIEQDGYTVEMLHYQSRPHLYVTANLYRPTNPKGRLPALVYVCGHSYRGRDGNKTEYQAHGIWLARHGYVCLLLDTLQLGEIAGIHHGTYRENRWWWHSRGYTPAGVECWNGVRGIDYLCSRPDVDPDRIAVTGISGGGAATFWIAAADERVRVAVPVSGMADLTSYVPNRVINGHCDCMFLYNTFQWPWTRIAALIAPRPLLFVNSDHDDIFPMDANERVINRLKRLYSVLGASDIVNNVVSVGGHAYRTDIRQAAFRFLNTHLKGDSKPITDSEIDLVTGSGNDLHFPIDPKKLRVFPQDSDLPADQLNTRIDESFVPPADVPLPAAGQFEPWRRGLLSELRRVTFGYFPERIPAARFFGSTAPEKEQLVTEPGITVELDRLAGPAGATSKQLILVVAQSGTETASEDWLKAAVGREAAIYRLATRGAAGSKWTAKNPPNYVERAHVLLGRTVDTGRIWDIAATLRYLSEEFGGKVPLLLAGEGKAAVLAAYAAAWAPEVSGLWLANPTPSHMDAGAPQLLNVLRVNDVPDMLGMLAPRALTLRSGNADLVKKVTAIYAAAGASDHLTVP